MRTICRQLMKRWSFSTPSLRRPARHPVRTRLQLEQLETRLVPSVDLLSNAAVPAATPEVQVLTSSSATPAGLPGQPGGYSPQQISQAYGFNQITFNNGTVNGDGSGQTIAIIDAYHQPNIVSNLATFDTTYGLAAPPSFRVVNQTGGSSLPTTTDQGWGLETSLDVEWAHAMAPGANILLVEANSSSYSDLMAAVDYARNQPGVSVISMSWGGSEWSSESAYDSYFTTPSGHNGVTFVASTGDSGSSGAPEYGSISPNVLAVGGTQLSTDSLGNYVSETGWSGSGGGISAYESQPSYQQGVVTQTSTMRAVPDVAYNGSSSSPFAIYDTSGYGGWLQVYGTSAGAPQWAALVAIANQGRALNGQGALDGPTQTLPALYQMPSSNYHDITTGSNGAYSAAAGYDLVTGLGTPKANQVVAGLVAFGNQALPTNQGPTVVTPASATPSPITGTTTSLSVLGNDDGGAASLIYTWSVSSAPAGAKSPTFSINGSNAAQNSTATFYQAGSYTFLATIKDASGLTTTSSVTVTVNQTLTSLAVTPGNATVGNGGSQQFTASARDQFGNAMNTQPGFTWTLASGGGTVSGGGLYTAPSSGTGTANVQATGSGLTATAAVTVGSAPAAPSNLTVTVVSMHQVNLAWTDNSGNETGFVIQRSTNGGNWTTLAKVGANVTTYADTSVNKQRTYSYRVYAYNSFGNSADSNTTSSVKPGAKGNAGANAATATLDNFSSPAGSGSAAAAPGNAFSSISDPLWQHLVDVLWANANWVDSLVSAGGDSFWLIWAENLAREAGPQLGH